MKTLLLCLRVMILTALLMGLTGCRTTAMKGTPTLSGEWEQREGPVENRIMLWPFLYYREPALTVMWPIFEKTPDHMALRPVYSVRGLESGQKVHRVLWPLGEFDTHRQHYRFFPVFWTPDSFTVFPVYWRDRDPFGEGGLHAVFPLWIYSRNRQNRHILHVMWPLARFERSPRVQSNRIFPLFSQGSAGEHHRWWISIPYGHSRSATGQSRYALAGLWGQSDSRSGSRRWLIPLYVQESRGEERSRWISLPYVRLVDGERRVDGIPLLLSWRTQQEQRDVLHLLGPLARISLGGEPTASHVFPFWYASADGSTRLTPIHQRGKRATGADWQAVLPFYYHQQHEGGSAWITPLGGITRHADGTGRTVTPLYARIEDRPGEVLHAVPPLLSWRIREPGLEDHRWLLGAVRFTRGERGGTSHVLPLYYHNPHNGTHLNPLWATWTQPNGTKTQMIPPLLSWRVQDPGADRQHVHGLLGLYRRSTRLSDGEPASSHLFPLYARTEDGGLFTPLFGQDASDTGQFRYLLTPLIGMYRNDWQGGWAFPFFSWRQHAETGHHDSRFLLWGRHQTAEEHQSTRMFPFFHRSRTRLAEAEVRRSPRTVAHDRLSVLIVYLRQQSRTLYPPERPLLLGGEAFTAQTRSQHRLFPLWASNRQSVDEGLSLSRQQVLWRVYDRRREQGGPSDPHDYVRHRVLWRVWHYERLNGEVSVDALPFITYDRRPDGFRRVSFLWRAFRYENHPESGRKLDVAFVPLLRGPRDRSSE